MTEHDYTEFQTEPAPDTLKALTAAVLELEEAEQDVARLEEELAAAQKRVVDLAEFQIPELMDDAGGLEELKVAGRQVRLAKSYHGSISKERATAAFAWLRDHGHGAVIRNEVVLRFGPGQDDHAEQFLETLPVSERGLATRREWVHHSTLNAFVKERMEAGDELPMDTFGAHVRRRAKVR